MTTQRPDLSSEPVRPGYRAPLFLILLAFALRVAALWAAQDATLVLDERAYLQRAEALLDGQGYVGSYQSWVQHTDSYKIADLPQYPGAYQPPGYVSFVAAALAVSQRNPLAVKLAQVLLGTASVWLVYLLGLAWYGERAAWIAGLLYALYPNLIAFTHLLWSETLFLFLLLGLFVVFARELGPPSAKRCVAAGALLGLAALTRSSILALLPVFVAWLVWRARPHWRTGLQRALLITLAAGVVIAPWSIRNYGVHGGFVLIDTNAPFNFWRGNHPTSFAKRFDPDAGYRHYQWPFKSIALHPVAHQPAPKLVHEAMVETGNLSPSDLEITRYAMQASLSHIRDEPLLFLRRIPTRLVDMWNPTSFLIRHYRLKAYGEVGKVTQAAVTAAAAMAYLCVLPLGLAGLALSWRDPRVLLAIALIAFFTASSMVAFGLTRFRLPLMPFFLLGVGYLLARWRSHST